MTSRPPRRSVLGLLAAASVAGPVAASMAGGPAARAAAASPGRPATPPRDLGPGGEYDRFVAQRAARDQFSGTVLVAHRGRPVLVRSHGMANRDASIPNGPDTVYCLASITKCFTAVAVAQLVQQGRMSFCDTLGAHLDGFPPEIAGTVTVHHLLTHTSGIGRPALGGGSPPGTGWTSFDEAMDGTLAAVRAAALQFAPGTRYAYSNDGFFVLGAIVARVSGRSYVEHVREHVFAPAGMSRTGFPGRPEVLADARVARPYWTQPSGTRIDFATSPYAPFTNGPAGGAYATAGDLLAFARALTSGRLLNPTFTGLVTGGKVALPATDPASRADFYGYGFRDAVVGDSLVVGHSGSGPGMATRLDIHPGGDWVSVVLGNYDTTIDPIVDLGRRLVTA